MILNCEALPALAIEEPGGSALLNYLSKELHSLKLNKSINCKLWTKSLGSSRRPHHQ